MSQAINDPIGFIWSLGGLHDVWVDTVRLDVGQRSLALETEDLNANFTDLAEDPGRRPCTLLFSGVSTFFLDLDLKEGVAISAAEVQSEGSGFKLVVDLREGAANFGGQSIALVFERLDVVYLQPVVRSQRTDILTGD